MHPVDPRRLISRRIAETSIEVAARVLKAREIQKARFAEDGIFCNAAMTNHLIEKHCPLGDDCKALLEKIMDKMELSARACNRIIRLSRTIADLASSADIHPEHISEAASYRFLDRRNIFD